MARGRCEGPGGTKRDRTERTGAERARAANSGLERARRQYVSALLSVSPGSACRNEGEIPAFMLHLVARLKRILEE